MSAIDPSRLPAAGSYLIDPGRSVVRFRARAVFGLLPVRGTLRIGHGEIRVVDPPELSRVRAVLPAGSFDTGNQERDAHVRSADLVDVAAHPEFVFESDRVRLSRGRPAAVGRLTVHGVTQPATLHIGEVAVRGRELAVHASARVDRYAFGVTRYKGMTGRRLRVLIEVVAERSSRLDLK